MLKRSFISIALAILAMQPHVASATDLDKAFSSLVGGGSANVEGPGSYSSATRNVFVAGGIEARFPRGSTRISLISITPPTMPTAGCGGISAHFGGFSFVSGAQIEQLIKNIGQNAIGVAVGVVLKELCPICQSVISEMTNLAQQASKLSIDSCAVATNLIYSMKDDKGSPNPAIKGTCGSYATQKGLASDQLSAMQGLDAVCGTMSSAMTEVDKIMKKAEGRDKDGKATGEKPDEETKQNAAQMRYLNTWGNKTWNTLNAVYGPLYPVVDDDGQPITNVTLPKLSDADKQVQFRNRVILLNLIGTEIVTKPDDKRGTAVEFKNVVNPALSAKNIFDLFMCGTAPSYSADGRPQDVQRAATLNSASYCKYFYGDPTNEKIGPTGQNGGSAWTVWTCPEKDLTGEDNRGNCIYMKQEPLASKDSPLRGPGFLPQVEGILYDAVAAVRNNAPKFDDKFMALTRSVNFPIYQAINAASVYPAATQDLLSTMSVLVAESLVYTQLEDLLSAQGRNPDYAALQEGSAARLYQALGEMNRQHLSRKESYGRLMTMQEGAVHAIRQVNLAVQKQVLTPELLGNTRFGLHNAEAVTAPAK